MHFRCIFENEWIWTSFPVRVCLCVVFLSICPSICDVLDVCFISFIVIFNSKTNVLQLTSRHMRKLQRTEITDGMSLPMRIINSTLIKWIGVENNQVVPYLDECILMRCWSHIAQPTTVLLMGPMMMMMLMKCNKKLKISLHTQTYDSHRWCRWTVST